MSSGLDKNDIANKISKINSLAELDGLRVYYLGKKGLLTSEMKSLSSLPDEARKANAEPYEFSAINISFFGTDSKTRKWCKQETYGGKLVENITQAVARDIMAESMLALEKEGYDIVLTVHDEIISEVQNGSIERFKTIMENAPTWAKNLPITVEAYEAQRYRK